MLQPEHRDVGTVLFRQLLERVFDLYQHALVSVQFALDSVRLDVLKPKLFDVHIFIDFVKIHCLLGTNFL